MSQLPAVIHHTRLPVKKGIGVRMRQLRLDKDASVRTVARVSGLSETHIRRLEKNGGFPKSDAIYRLANYYDVPMEFIMSGDGLGDRVLTTPLTELLR